MNESQPRNSEAIYQMLKAEIIDLVLKPGQNVSENMLCERFGVSRTPVRTALQRLQSDGLMDVVPYKGSTVTLLDFAEIKQMVYMRVAVETAVLQDFIPVCTPFLLEKIRYQIRKQHVLTAGDFKLPQFYEMDSQMHSIWFRAMKQERLWAMIQKAQIHYTRFRMLDIMAANNFPAIIMQHEDLFQTIETKKVDAVGPIIQKHLYGGIERLESRLTTDFADYFLPEENFDA